MTIRSLKAGSTAALVDSEYNPRLLALIASGVPLLAGLVVMAFQYFVNEKLSAATGLAQLDSQAIWITALSVLTLASLFATPFWQIGFFRAALMTARSGSGRPGDLLEGFRRWAPIFRLFLLQLLIFLALAAICFETASLLFSFSPLSSPMIDILEPIIREATAGGEAMASEIFLEKVMSEAVMKQLNIAMIPMYVLWGILFAAIGIPLFYSFRMAPFVIMDESCGALAALLTSSRLAKRKRFFLFRLDLSFWWYYTAVLLIPVVANIDLLLALFQITPPLPDAVMYFCPFLIAAALQLLLAWCSYSYVQVTYAGFYQHQKTALPAPPPRPAPGPSPWDD